MLVTPRVQIEQVLRRLAFLDSADHHPLVHTLSGQIRPVGRLSWDELVLDAAIVTLLKEDFETFWAREEWFRVRRLPFRRGYLLHGPPGNGKTSAIRAMMSSRRLSAFTMRLFGPQTDDSDLEAVFEQAAKHRPAIVLLEDLDRAFPRSGQTKSPLSLQSLLNCLDGVSTPEGVVVIATANDPLALDPAVLKRPGRFDRVIHFPSPSERLRRDYFRKMHPDLDGDRLVPVVAESDGMSFAQLREAYILAGQQSFLRGDDISAEDLLTAVQAR
jgi:SpoVK/Ycf46/Vps4 family AAA+-type ATPase